jgi:hypothetical protein
MPGLSKETVVDIWLSSDDAVRVLEKGYKIIHAAVEYFYLVRFLQSIESHYQLICRIAAMGIG